MQQDDEDISNQINSISRLRWACRRGMLELDVILTKFLDDVYLTLPTESKKQFVRLLTHSDPELFAWLMGQAHPAEAELIDIINRIRQHVRA